MSTISSVNFRGKVVNQCPTGNCPAPQYATTNFKGYPADSYEGPKKNKHTGLKILGGVAVIAGAIAGLGLSHGRLESGWYQKVGDEWYGKACKAVTSNCNKWFNWTKGKCVQGWDAVKGWFKKDK